VPHIVGKLSTRITTFFRPYLNQRFAQEIMGFQNRISILRISGISRPPTWESCDKMTFGCRPSGQAQRILEGGRWWLPQSLSRGESCESMFVHGLLIHKKCSNYTLTNLLFGLCRFVWIIDSLVICFNLHPKALAHPFAPKMLRARKCTPSPYLSVVFTFGLIVKSIKEFGGASTSHNWLHPLSH
jgi:hypothetical protein